MSERQVETAEERFADELRFLAAHDDGPRPRGWRLTPAAVLTFVLGSDGPLRLAAPVEGLPAERVVAGKFVGDRGLVERAVVTLAGGRGLLLVGEPGTAKSMLSELLAAAISGTSRLTVQGTAGTTEDQLRYGWNYSLLIAKGPHEAALVPSPVLTAMRLGRIVRVEEVTRCLPEVQDALIAVLSDRRLAVAELPTPGGEAHTEFARPGFNVIATANLRDQGVSEMSSALKRRFNFEVVPPIGDLGAEVALVRRQAEQALAEVGQPLRVDDEVLRSLVLAFRDLRDGVTEEGWAVDRPTSALSTAEAVGVATSLGLSAAFLAGRDPLSLVPAYLVGAVRKDDPRDLAKLLAYWDGVVKRRAEAEAGATGGPWTRLHELRRVLETTR